jgi:uncharacterized protein GlcG (DUF336 family)
MRKKFLVAATLGALLAPMTGQTARAADAPLSVQVPRLTLATVRKMAHAAIAACEKAGFQVAVTVVDRDGIPQIMERDTLAAPLAVKISRMKAYTAAMFNVKGSELRKGTRRVALARAGTHLVLSAGSVPIAVGGRFYGAIGVSGTPDGMVDERCAQAGLDAVHDDLDLQ